MHPQLQLLAAIHEAQTKFIDTESKAVFRDLLANLLTLTNSEYGFIGEVLYKDELPYLKTHAITDIAWSDETRALYNDNVDSGLEFTNLETLFGAALKSGELVIANNPLEDTRAGGIPDGHPSLDAFLGLPIYHGETMLGLVGIANRPDGYNSTIADFLNPFLTTCGTIINAIRMSARQSQLEAQLINAQRLETVGTLAGGIAHDFNNVLATIQGLAEISLGNEATTQANLQKILTASRRAAKLVQQILMFSNTTKPETKIIDLSRLTVDALEMVKATIPASININYTDVGEPLAIEADGGQIQQIVTNLCTNAYQAMEQSGGLLEVKLTREDHCPLVAPNHEQGHWARIMVSDSGPGIRQDLVDRIFDPFFTTKEVGKGSGLGLAVVSRIVADHQGHLAVKSSEGKGTSFEVYLPISDLELSPEAKSTERPGTPAQKPGDRILVVEDETELANIYAEYFSARGYDVTLSSNGSDALHIMRNQAHSIDLLLTDHSMPEMTGLELVRQLRELGFDTPAIVSTGHLEVPENIDNLNVEVVFKPVRFQVLANLIDRMLVD
jgi:signal transduction histidine kinase